jgi:hypothetical protein
MAGDLAARVLEALERDDAEAVKHVLGDNVNALLGASRNTTLHCAAAKARVSSVRALLESPGIEVNPRNVHQDTPLHFASTAPGAAGCVSLLLRAGADVTAQNLDGSTPLMCASGGGHVLTLQLLLRDAAGATTVNATDTQARTALHFAAAGEQAAAALQCCRALVASGAQCSVRNGQGRTPLVEALSRRPVDAALCDFLLENTHDEAAYISEEEERATALKCNADERARHRKHREVRAVPCETSSSSDEGDAPPNVAADAADDKQATAAPAPEESGDQPSVWHVATSRRRHKKQTPAVEGASQPEARLVGTWPELAERPFPDVQQHVSEPTPLVERAAQPEALPAGDREEWCAIRRARYPDLEILEVELSHLCGVGIDTLSAAQLDALERFHGERLHAARDAQVVLARQQARQEALAQVVRRVPPSLVA